jgi:hypothetical protein
MRGTSADANQKKKKKIKQKNKIKIVKLLNYFWKREFLLKDAKKKNGNRKKGESEISEK